MGVVYRALDTKFGRPVAIKFVSADLSDAGARHRFRREAQTASSLNHPHILTVHDIGEHEGREYLVTEFVDGGTLREWHAAETRSWRQVVDLLVGVADGLAADYAPAHAALSLAWSSMGDLGVPDKAGVMRTAAARALELDPELSDAHVAMASVKAVDWDWAGAEVAFARGLELNPDSVDGCGCYAVMLATMGRLPQAIAIGQHGVEVNPLSGVMHFVLARSGRRAAAIQIADRISATDHCGASLIYISLGERDRGFEQLAKAVDAHEPPVVLVKVSAAFDTVRSDPRFQAQLARLKFPN